MNISVPASVSIHGIRLVNLAMDEVLAAIEAALAACSPRVSAKSNNCALKSLAPAMKR